jgi:hypothetical protein
MLEEGETCIPLSGAGLIKEDKKDSEDLIQVKYTTKQSYSIRLEDLTKGERNAALQDRTFRMDIAFARNGGQLSEYVLIPRRVYMRLKKNDSA